MSAISVTHSQDAMRAFLYVSDSAEDGYPGKEELLAELNNHGVIHGINTATLEVMAKTKTRNVYVEVAQGDFPVPGTPGRIEILIDVSNKGKPRKIAGGRVDHHDISYVVNVTKGTPLVKHIPSVPGKPGMTVFQVPIEPMPVPDKPLIAGRGTKISPDNANILIADINGAILVSSDGEIDVIDSKVVSGNIDYSTGDIRFSGNLRITGTVRAGFEVEAEGDCFISGNVEDAKIICRQDIEIIGGAIGATKALLKCAGSIKVKHVANFNVQAGEDIHILEDSLHCTLSAEGSVKAKTIVGGSVSAWKIIEAESIGAEAEPKTIVDLGGQHELLKKKDALLRQLAALTAEIGSVKEGMFFLVRDELDAAGNLHEGSLARLKIMKGSHRQRKEKYTQVQTALETVDEKLKNSPVPSVKAHTVYPNTIIKFGTFEKCIKEKITHARITVDSEKIIIGQY